MRLYSLAEKKLICQFVESKRTGDIKNLEIGFLLKKRLSCFALKWEIEPVPTVTIYLNHDGNGNGTSIDENYFAIADFIYFIEELESSGFIKLQHIPSQQENEPGLLYDRELYEYNASKDEFDSRTSGQEVTIKGEKYVLTAYTFPKDRQIIYNDFASDLKRCATSIIYPLPLAESYVDNHFRTLEDKRYEENNSIALKSVSIANRTLIISAVALIASATGCYFSYLGIKQSAEPTVISQSQINHLDSVIQTHSMSEPIKIISNDTIMVLPVQSSKNKK